MVDPYFALSSLSCVGTASLCGVVADLTPRGIQVLRRGVRLTTMDLSLSHEPPCPAVFRQTELQVSMPHLSANEFPIKTPPVMSPPAMTPPNDTDTK